MSENRKLPSLPQKPDAVILTLLSRSRQFLAHALSHADNKSTIDRMLTIHGLDNSIEYLLRIIMKHLDIEAITGKSIDTAELSSLAGEVNRFLRGNYNFALPYISEIKLLRQIRNLVQHGMVDPEPDLKRWCTVTERFFQRVLEKIFGIGPEEIRISSIIEHPEVQKHLVLAEKYIDDSKFQEAVTACRNAFENALYEKLMTSNLRLMSLPILAEISLNKEQFYPFYASFFDELELVRLGINLTKYDQFNDYLHYLPNKKFLGHLKLQRHWKRDDAVFCYNFVTDTILKWQNEEIIHGKLDNSDNEYTYKAKLNGVEFHKCDDICDVAIGCIQHGQTHINSVEITKILQPGNDYEYWLEGYTNGEMTFRRKWQVKLKTITGRLLTHEPERWHYVIWYTYVKEIEEP
ncbi:MAG: hypothetical protein GY801_45870 [bacterium]|nr:hypothetical protein [bacterium]